MPHNTMSLQALQWTFSPLEVLTTPGPEARASVTAETSELELDEKGGGTLTWTRSASGASAIVQRELFDLLSENGMADPSMVNTLTFKSGAFTLEPDALPMQVEGADRAPLGPEPRRLAIRMPYDREALRTLKIRFPEAWTLQTAPPAPFRASNALGTSERTVTVEGHLIPVVQSWKGTHGEHSATAAPDLQAFAGLQSPLALPALKFQ